MNKHLVITTFSLLLLCGCQTQYEPDSFGSEIQKLGKVEDLKILKAGEAMIAVSPACQGRVFTSTSNGMNGRSYGWFNAEKVQSDGYMTSMAALGGEARIWFGPEWGPHSTCFDPGAEQIPANFRRPPALNQVAFELVDETDQ